MIVVGRVGRISSGMKGTLLNRKIKSGSDPFSVGGLVFTLVSRAENILSYINYPERCSRARNNKIKKGTILVLQPKRDEEDER